MSDTRQRLDFPYTLAICALSVIATALAASGDAGWLVADRARILGEPWRALTGPLVHATWGHLARDLALCAIVGAGFERPLRRVWPALCGFGLAVPVAVALAYEPAHVAYYGTSGLSHAMIAAAVAWCLAARGVASSHALARWLPVAAGAALLGKLAYEVATGAPLFPMQLGPGVEQAPIAHLSGAVIGLVVVGPFLASAAGRAASQPG